MKKMLLILITLLVLGTSSSFAESRQITIVVDGYVINTDVKPVIVNDRTLVPLRVISESLGAEVGWNNRTREVTLNFSELGSVVKMKIDSRNYNINGYNGTMDVEPQIISGRTMVPIRFISENLGFEVQWDNDTRTVYVYSEYEYSGDIEEASSLLSLVIGEEYTSETYIGFEGLEELDMGEYYLFRVYEDDRDHEVTLGWYYVSMNMDEIYEWDIETDMLIPIY